MSESVHQRRWSSQEYRPCVADLEAVCYVAREDSSAAIGEHNLQQCAGAKNKGREMEVFLERSRMLLSWIHSNSLQVSDQFLLVLRAWGEESPYLSSTTDGDPCRGAISIVVDMSQKPSGRSESPAGEATEFRG